MANDKSSHGPKASAKAETIHLKVFMHCEGCKKKVKRTLNSIEGVEAVDVDGELGKVTITSTMDSAVLIKKLEKAGKVAELIPNGVSCGNKGKGQQKAGKQANDAKTRGGDFREDAKNRDGDDGEFFDDASSINEPNGKHQEENNNNDNGGGDNKNKSNRNSNNNNNNNNNNSHNSNNGQGGKKKKGGGGGGGEAGMNVSYELGMNAGIPYYEVGMNAFYESGTNRNNASKNIAPIMVETAYSNSLESAEYATHMFSDENANNCAIM